MHVITGGAGFLGEHLTKRCVAQGNPVRILDINKPAYDSAGVDVVRGDVCDQDVIDRTCVGADVVIHNAALVPLSRSGDRFWKVNVEGTRNVINACKRAGVRKLIFISSSSVFGVPDSDIAITEETPLAPFEAYGKSKAEAESLCHQAKNKLDISIVRPRTILGPSRMGILSLIFDWVKENHRVYILGSGNNRYQMVSAADLVEAIMCIAERPCRGQDFNIGATDFGSLRTDLESFIQNVSSKSKIVSVPAWIARATLPILGSLRLSPFVSYQYHIADRSVYFGMDKAKRLLDFTPEQSNIDMLTRAYRWYVEHKDDSGGGSVHTKKPSAGIFKLLKFIP